MIAILKVVAIAAGLLPDAVCTAAWCWSLVMLAASVHGARFECSREVLMGSREALMGVRLWSGQMAS